MTPKFLKEQIAKAETQLAAAYAAQSEGLIGGLYNYSMDTGQGKTSVTRMTETSLNKLIDSLLNRIVMLEARLRGNNVLIARPGF